MSESWPSSKVDLAEQNLRNFKSMCADFIARSPYRVVEHRKDENRTIELDPVPPYIGLLFGEFVHNLRCALDHTVFNLTRSNAKNLSKQMRQRFKKDGSSFPICIERSHWEHDPERSRGGLDRAGGVAPGALEVIKAAQPFNVEEKAESHWLALLTSLDNRDKHRQLNVAVTDPFLISVETSPGSYAISPVSSTRKEGEGIIVTGDAATIGVQPFLALSLTEQGPAPGAVLWVPEIDPLLKVLSGITADGFFPEWLLEKAKGVLDDLEPFLV